VDDRTKRSNLPDNRDVPAGAVGDEASGTRGTGEYFGDILERRVKRRTILKGAGAVSVGLVLGGGGILPGKVRADDEDPGERIRFKPIAPSSADQVIVSDGYSHGIILRWGDPLFPGAPDFKLDNQSRARQEQQFGFNCDFIGWFPQPCSDVPSGDELASMGVKYFDLSRDSSKQALLTVNHEYTSGYQMFPGYQIKDDDPFVGADPTRDQVETEIAAHGMSVVEIELRDGKWHFVIDSPFNRRITGYTEIEIAGPLGGHALLQTSGGYDDSGTKVWGMLNNCAGGKTPWGTVLSCEENFDQYFANFGEDPLSLRIAAPSGPSDRKWENHEQRFDLSIHPNEYNRFGYVVEIDPYDPSSKPKKRTALGRFKHEGAVPAIGPDGRMVIYSGDDARFEYVYKFVTDDKFDPHDRGHNMNLLDHGTLYVAKFNDDGTGEWLALPEDAGSIINTRGAADALGATKMDRPEDVDVSPTTGKVYITMTKNEKRGTGESEGLQADPGVDAANPRDDNRWGHIIEIIEGTDGGMDHTSVVFRWEMFMLCGDPSQQGGITELNDLTADEAYFAGFDPSEVSPIAAPDNIVFDKIGNLWIATDGQPSAPGFGQNDGVFACPTEGPSRGWNRQFLSGIPGGEICGPEFSGDNRSFFCGIQHPGEGGGLPNTKSGWPDGDNPPKPSIIAVRHRDGEKIGS
jgi:secreted PhoX family phosphatase